MPFSIKPIASHTLPSLPTIRFGSGQGTTPYEFMGQVSQGPLEKILNGLGLKTIHSIELPEGRLDILA